jgi:hypothetical protein
MRSSVFLSVVLLALVLVQVALAQPTVPRVRSGGEYWQRSECSWTSWMVLAKELPGRLSRSWPASLDDPSALLHLDWNVTRWPAVTRFSKGQLLTAVPDEVGGIFIKDIDGASWLRVMRPESVLNENEQPNEAAVCFVRAHKKYLKPAQ